jgi:hypothetical protein
VDWLLEEKIDQARSYMQKVDGEEGLLWRFLEQEEVRAASPGDSLGEKRGEEIAHRSREGRLDKGDVDDYGHVVLLLQSRWKEPAWEKPVWKKPAWGQGEPSWENDSSENDASENDSPEEGLSGRKGEK